MCPGSGAASCCTFSPPSSRSWGPPPPSARPTGPPPRPPAAAAPAAQPVNCTITTQEDGTPICLYAPPDLLNVGQLEGLLGQALYDASPAQVDALQSAPGAGRGQPHRPPRPRRRRRQRGADLGAHGGPGRAAAAPGGRDQGPGAHGGPAARGGLAAGGRAAPGRRRRPTTPGWSTSSGPGSTPASTSAC